MRTRFMLLILSAAALLGSGAIAQEFSDDGAVDQMNRRFQHMEEMMDQARNAQGEERQVPMQEHMALMREQMQAMHGMMGSGGMMQNQGVEDEPAPQVQHMQQRMDMMQQMMEHMLERHEMMMGNMNQ